MKWEYYTYYQKGAIKNNTVQELQTKLTEMGEDGWELVNVISQIDSDSSSANLPDDNSIDCCESVYTSSNVLIFKRPSME